MKRAHFWRRLNCLFFQSPMRTEVWGFFFLSLFLLYVQPIKGDWYGDAAIFMLILTSVANLYVIYRLFFGFKWKWFITILKP